jgi:4-alpha-glucanotransferase
VSEGIVRPALRALAERVGIVSSYHSIDGQHRVTSEETALLLLEAMGLACDSDAAIERELAAWDARAAARLLPPVRVVEADALARDGGFVLHIEHTSKGEHHTELQLEGGETLRFAGTIEPGSPIALQLTGPLPLGYHRLRHTRITGDGERGFDTRASEQRLIVVPTRCVAPPDRALGFGAQLYSARGAVESGTGDFGTLRELIAFAAATELDFVALSPLCALDLRAIDVSPYAPTSRLALHPLYLDVSALPDAAHAPSATWSRTIDHAAVLRDKLALAASWHARGTLDVATPLDDSLERYALFSAIAEHTGERDFTRWPSELRDARGRPVAALAAQLAERVAFHRALQNRLSAQLGAAAAEGRRAGLRVGIVSDCPVGSAAGGADVWSEPELFARGAEMGAPPDAYARDGQSWGLAPLIPWRSHEDGHRFFSALVRRAMQGAGGVRIDHIIGMVRQYWVPSGRSGKDGAYVRCAAQEWFGIIALESVRNGCIVIGEDLGTVPDGLREELHRRGILRSHVALFERTHDGGFSAPERYSPLAMASALTHDLPALIELWQGDDLTRKHQLGILDAEQLEQARGERAHTRYKLLEALRHAGLLPHDAPEPSCEQLHRLLCEWLARAPSLLALSLDDIAGEPVGVNIPGTGSEAGNWKRRMLRSASDLESDDGLCTWLRALARSRR